MVLTLTPTLLSAILLGCEGVIYWRHPLVSSQQIRKGEVIMSKCPAQVPPKQTKTASRFADAVRNLSLGENRAVAEKTAGEPMHIISVFPAVGRGGNTTRDRLADRDTINNRLSGATRHR
jgi:hypothetical protein